MGKGSFESILILPPRGRLDPRVNNQRCFVTPISAVSNSDFVLGASYLAIPKGGCYVTYISDTDCYFNIWDGRDGGSMSAAVGTSPFFPAGVHVSWWHREEDNGLAVIQKSAGGNLYHWLSSP